MSSREEIDRLTYYDVSWASVLDGPGTRVVLYLRGCHLRCPWCHSPHSWKLEPDLLFFETRCLHCGICESVCPNGVHRLEAGKHLLDRAECRKCGACVQACPVTVSGKPMGGALALPACSAEPEDVMHMLHPQLDLLKPIGGLTVSGGEPLLQYKPLTALLSLCEEEGFHVAIETSGAVPGEALALLAPVVDCWLYGLRPADSARGSAGKTGDSSLVSRNLEFLCARAASRIIIRTPVIPGMTDAPRSLSMISQVMQANDLRELELLPFNPYSSHYYKAMGLAYPLEDLRPPTAESMASIVTFLEGAGIDARVVR